MTKSTENVTGGCPFTKKTCPVTKKHATPCPIMNSLIHMGYLDYKKEWSKQEVQDALKKIKMSNFVAFLQTNIVHALLKNHNLPFTVKSLQIHNLMEHDASLSRKDDFLGDCVKFNKKV